jgi:hypothetical protein
MLIKHPLEAGIGQERNPYV